ncbi:MAG: PHP domain-containing protein [Candidatus Sungbacteria bacterium]|uniref:PHP domain-containing protein n=1 Tax=Candidatus Sungiibacteriota bacterium TaxID=2750080 RepID=A0A9D6LRM4_9BACT|nr:PHP domain-containing protein [Candidatus Sungbacteria bacterium]
MIDYQIQTTASDGKFSPRECVKMAKENGLISVAITDHDTVGGVREGLEAGKEFDIEVIPGIEISAHEPDGNIHMLGFGIDYEDPALITQLEELKDDRAVRAKLMVEKLKELGFYIEYESVRARSSGLIARPHMAEEIFANPLNKEKLEAENIHDSRDLFEHYLGDSGRAYVHRVPLSTKEAINIIVRARGVPVWSHPLIPLNDFKICEERLIRFMPWGLVGIEAIGNFSEDDTKFLNALAGKYRLLRTAGSDFHDVFVRDEHPDDGATRIGEYYAFGYPTEGIRENLLAAIKRAQSPVVSRVSI